MHGVSLGGAGEDMTSNHRMQRTRRLRFVSMLNAYWRRVADAYRSATMRFFTVLLLGSVLAVGCQRSVRLPDVAAIPTAQREMARSNWGRVQKAFEAHDN